MKFCGFAWIRAIYAIRARIRESSVEVFLGDFKGFRVRDYEIRLIVYRIVERDESLKSVKKPNTLFLFEF